MVRTRPVYALEEASLTVHLKTVILFTLVRRNRQQILRKAMCYIPTDFSFYIQLMAFPATKQCRRFVHHSHRACPKQSEPLIACDEVEQSSGFCLFW